MPRYYGDRYLPEPVRFVAMTDEEKVRAARLTARFAAQWAARFVAWPVTDRSVMRLGTLTRTPTNRAAVIDELFDWLAGLLVARGLPKVWAGLVLVHRGRAVLDQHDGVPAHLFLTSEQFARLQEEWRRHGLPEDLYFPADAQRVIPNRDDVGGDLVMGPGWYSPLEWAGGQAAAPAELSPPSDREDEHVFIQACGEFHRALARRRAELTEPGRELDTVELGTVEALTRMVASLLSEMSKRYQRRRIWAGQPADREAEST